MNSVRRYPANFVSAGLRILVAIVALGVCVVSVATSGWLMLLTFTWQSNFMIAASFLWTAWALIADRRTPPEWLAGSSVFYIAITGLVYNLVISPGTFRVGDTVVAGLTRSDIAHVIVPIAATVIWLIFEEHRRIPFAYIWIWQVYLVVYLALIIAVIHLADGVSAPYPFLDVPALGWTAVLTELLKLVLAFTALAALLVTTDRTLPPRTVISEHDRFDEYYRKNAATPTRR
jgi:hypothetical protein